MCTRSMNLTPCGVRINHNQSIIVSGLTIRYSKLELPLNML